MASRTAGYLKLFGQVFEEGSRVTGPPQGQGVLTASESLSRAMEEHAEALRRDTQAREGFWGRVFGSPSGRAGIREEQEEISRRRAESKGEAAQDPTVASRIRDAFTWMTNQLKWRGDTQQKERQAIIDKMYDPNDPNVRQRHYRMGMGYSDVTEAVNRARAAREQREAAGQWGFVGRMGDKLGGFFQNVAALALRLASPITAVLGLSKLAMAGAERWHSQQERFASYNSRMAAAYGMAAAGQIRRDFGYAQALSDSTKRRVEARERYLDAWEPFRRSIGKAQDEMAEWLYDVGSGVGKTWESVMAMGNWIFSGFQPQGGKVFKGLPGQFDQTGFRIGGSAAPIMDLIRAEAMGIAGMDLDNNYVLREIPKEILRQRHWWNNPNRP